MRATFHPENLHVPKKHIFRGDLDSFRESWPTKIVHTSHLKFSALLELMRKNSTSKCLLMCVMLCREREHDRDGRSSRF